MPLTQEQVNQLAKEAAAQAGGTISYQDALKAAANYGITPEQVNAALSTGVITGAPLSVIGNVSPIEGLNTSPEKLSRPTPSLVDQILASSDPTKWTGEGFGSAQANAEDMAKVLSAAGITNIGQLGVRTVPGGQTQDYDGNVYQLPDTQQYYNKDTGQAVTPGYDRAGGNIFSGTFAGSGSTGYGVQFDAQGNPHFYTQYGGSTSNIGDIAPILGIASMAFGLPGLLGGMANTGLGLGLGAAGEAALGGATIGGLTSAATGGNVLQGALLGGAGGYLSNALSAGITDKATLQAAMDADIAGGMVPEFGTNAAYDSFMANAMTPAARLALETQIASGNGAWLGENVPSGVPEWDQAFTNAGGTFDTAYTTPTTTATRADLPQASYSNEGRNYPTPESTQGTGGSPVNASLSAPGGLPLVTVNTPTTTTPTTTTTTPLDLKTVTDIAKVVTTVGGLLGGGALVNNALGGGGGSNVFPTQSVPVGNQDYYNAIQQYYNAYLPTQPRDVATPLQNWYSKKYGA